MRAVRALGLAVGLLAVTTSHAALVSGVFDFSAKFAADAPFPEIHGRVSYSFDDAITNAATISIENFNFPVASPIVANYYPVFLGVAETFWIGGSADTLIQLSQTSNDFLLVFSGFLSRTSTRPDIAGYVYFPEGGGSGVRASSTSVTLSPVPIPSSALLAGTGLLLMSALGLKKRLSSASKALR